MYDFNWVVRSGILLYKFVCHISRVVDSREGAQGVAVPLCIGNVIFNQGWGQVQLTKYSSTPSTPNIYQVQVLVKYSFFLKVLKYIKYFHIKYKYKYKYSY